MNRLKVCFVGIGSIARRHIRNLHSICTIRNIDLQADAVRRNPGSGPVEGIRNIFFDINDVPEDYDVIFITNPTELHLETLELFHSKGKHFFIEKPAVSISKIEMAQGFELRKGSLYYVACPLRYNAVIQYIKNNVDFKKVISVRSISSSYLPDWRPGKDYRDTYSAHRDQGGGVSIDLIHEWDYLTYLLGWPNKVLSMIGKKSSLEIDSDDYAIYIAEYNNHIVELHLDYFGKSTIRNIELMTTEETIIGDIAQNKITNLTSGEIIDFNEERDDFQRRELEHFIDMVEGKAEKEEGFTHSIRVLELTQGKVQ